MLVTACWRTLPPEKVCSSVRSETCSELLLVTTSKALVPSSVALVSNSFLLLVAYECQSLRCPCFCIDVS